MGDKKYPMIFSYDKPFQQLKEEGVVYTVRSNPKPENPVWISRGRRQSKEFDAEIVERTVVNPRQGDVLEEFLDKSGFGSVEEWKGKIEENGRTNSVPVEGYLYRVER